MSVVIETTLGDITVDLYVKERPKTCTNFLKLCKTKYYNYNLFHSVQRGFIAQTGDPTGSGRGGESIYGILYGPQAKYYEAEKIPIIKHIKPGLISMVNCGDQMLGSQFFITLGEKLTYLDAEHCVFGEVTEGHDVLEKLNEAICDGENRPYQDIRITHTVILDDPFDNPRGLEVPSRSPSPTPEMLDSGRIRADEDIDDSKGKTMEELEEIIKEKEAKARATILEMVGDLPDAEIAPPENVLFVCKLNPVTSDEDLEIIFSRFGKVKSCEVIKDQKSGESLQYAFVEFEDRKACEDAYFKMDNVLIDDRRIHVDFSQSVSKYKWKGKGRGVEITDNNKSKSDSTTRRPRAAWIRDPSASKSHSSDDFKGERDNSWKKSRDARIAHANEGSRKHWSRSPPRYSRGHESTQKRKSDDKDHKSTDEKLLKLLKKEMKKQKKKKSKSKRKAGRRSSSASDSSSDDGDSPPRRKMKTK
ncbi:unnamed protein product [Orchesella dallaii]|uniref:Peptidyl-prolyl cis-trans isomerase n=1 Tax=Orchesella dallaii TaxID=48710 RepID=A0ABP1QTL6_9HEXA